MFATVPVGAVLLAWFTAMALWPFRRPRPLAVLAWISAILVIEAPFTFMALIAASVLPELLTGGPASVGSRVGMALNLATVAGLVVVARRAWSARPALDRALAEGLCQVRAAERRPTGRGRPGRPPLGALLVPFPFRPRQVERTRDLSYGEHGPANRLDVYRHRSRPTGAPMLIHLHGGRFRWGRKSREALPLLHRLARDGWTCISADYRVASSPAEAFPASLVDVKRLLAWSRAHADELGIDPGSIVVTGSSAGAHLALMAALTPAHEAFQPGFEAADTSVAAAVGFYGWYGDLGTTAGPPSTPLAYDAAPAPPTLLVHGELDTYTPIEGADALAEHLRSGSPNPVALARLPGAQHSFDLLRSVRYEAVVDAVASFTDGVVRATPRPPAG